MHTMWILQEMDMILSALRSTCAMMMSVRHQIFNSYGYMGTTEHVMRGQLFLDEAQALGRPQG